MTSKKGLPMHITPTYQRCLIGLMLGASAGISAFAAEADDSPVDSCLTAWGSHPFGKNPPYKTLSTSVKVFGIGPETADTEVTQAPALILVNPGVTVGGDSVVQVLNPNGWYCFRTTVSVMGGLTIKAHCKAHLATTAGDVLAGANAADGKGVTVLGTTQVERVGCD
jgi:hypothetical protein